MLAYGAEDCPTYGICRDRTKVSLTALVKSLIDSGYLLIEGTAYPTLDVTSKGQEALQGSGAVASWQREKPRFDSSVKEPLCERAASKIAPRTSPADQQLLERLRQLRTELAEEEGVASFVIFHERTLKAIASYKPVTSAALMEIPGIGYRKIERYGRRVLQVVNEHK